MLKYFILILLAGSLTLTSKPKESDMVESGFEIRDNLYSQMTNVLNEIHDSYKQDTVFLRNLDEAQILWRQFLEAQSTARFSSVSDEGAKYPPNYCEIYYQIELIEQRIKVLKKWITGSDPDNDCRGSIKLKSTLIREKNE